MKIDERIKAIQYKLLNTSDQNLRAEPRGLALHVLRPFSLTLCLSFTGEDGAATGAMGVTSWVEADAASSAAVVDAGMTASNDLL